MNVTKAPCKIGDIHRDVGEVRKVGNLWIPPLLHLFFDQNIVILTQMRYASVAAEEAGNLLVSPFGSGPCIRVIHSSEVLIIRPSLLVMVNVGSENIS